jgi:hypothetical protein
MLFFLTIEMSSEMFRYEAGDVTWIEWVELMLWEASSLV